MSGELRTEGAGEDAARKHIVIWRFSDGKAGHDNQSLGLTGALSDATHCEVHSLRPLSALEALTGIVSGRGFADRPRPDPDLIIGAGHATHLSMLAARSSRGGRVVVLMTPSLPPRLFDLCLIPEHDTPRPRDNVIVTVGALNRVRPGADRDPTSGLILLGGPSPHFHFDSSSVLAQIEAIVAKEQRVTWTAATSRRTPAALTELLNSVDAANFRLVPVAATSPGWLVDELGRCGIAWVSEDSASMVYEAMSSGASVGLLTLERRDLNRIARGIDKLVAAGKVVRFESWMENVPLHPPSAPLNEAERCARLILERWPQLTTAV